MENKSEFTDALRDYVLKEIIKAEAAITTGEMEKARVFISCAIGAFEVGHDFANPAELGTARMAIDRASKNWQKRNSFFGKIWG